MVHGDGPRVSRYVGAPPADSAAVIGGSLFELQLRSWHRVRLRELGRTAEPLPRFGVLVWAMHPLGAHRKVNRIAGSRLDSIPVTVIDWHGAPATVRRITPLLGIPDGAIGAEAGKTGC